MPAFPGLFAQVTLTTLTALPTLATISAMLTFSTLSAVSAFLAWAHRMKLLLVGDDLLILFHLFIHRFLICNMLLLKELLLLSQVYNVRLSI